MLKKISCYLCVVLLLFTGCFEPESTDSKEIEEPKNEGSGSTETPKEPKEEKKPLVDKPVLGEKNLGSIFFFGNSHTFNTSNLETMIKENGYDAKIYHIHTGGNVPLGNDYCINSKKDILNLLCGAIYACSEDGYRKNIFGRDHLSNLLNQEKDIKDNVAKYFPEDVSWVIVHDGSVHNSLTSAGAFMGLASAFGAKTACYQSWDLKEYSVYAAKQFHLPMIPVGGTIHHPAATINTHMVNAEYQLNDGHMNNKGKYIYCVLFTHFFTGLPIDEIKGNGGLPTTAPTAGDKTYLTDENKKEMKELMKNTLAATDKIFSGNKPYYEYVKNFDAFSLCESIEDSKECVVELQLSQPAIFNLPKGDNGKKIKVEVKSDKNTVVPDIWFYDTAEKKLIAQSTNTEYLQNYTFTGNGDNWETDGSKVLIVTRRGKTIQSGDVKVSKEDYTIEPDEWGLNSIIDEAIDETVHFTITVSFVD